MAKISFIGLLVLGVLLLLGVSLELIGFGIGVIGLLISAIAIPAATVQGKRQLDRLNVVSEGLGQGIDQLKGEVQTYYIDVFPEFMPAIIKLLDEAKKSITIFCDLPAYGVVSCPDRHRRYVELIEAKARSRIPVQVLHLGEDAREESLGRQFEANWPELSQRASVADFVDANRENFNEEDPKASFLTLVQEKQTETIKSFKEAGVIAVSTSLIMPLYFWIVDGERAVFALTEFSAKAHEVGFSTASDRLTEAMEGIFGRYRRFPG